MRDAFSLILIGFVLAGWGLTGCWIYKEPPTKPSIFSWVTVIVATIFIGAAMFVSGWIYAAVIFFEILFA